MVEGKKSAPITAGNNIVPTIQTLNMVSQKIIQVNKPTGYYGDREKTKTFTYQVYLYWMVNAAGFPNNQIKVVFAASYYQDKTLK